MNAKLIGHWTSCDSRSDLDSRLRKLTDPIATHVITEDAASWGYMTLADLVVPIGFANAGIEPQAVAVGDVIAIGAGATVIGMDRRQSELVFHYQMPTVFHEFVKVDERGFIIKDELGFVWLSLEGQERWTFSADDIVERFALAGNELSGETMEGHLFSVRIPGFDIRSSSSEG